MMLLYSFTCSGNKVFVNKLNHNYIASKAFYLKQKAVEGFTRKGILEGQRAEGLNSKAKHIDYAMNGVIFPMHGAHCII